MFICIIPYIGTCFPVGRNISMISRHYASAAGKNWPNIGSHWARISYNHTGAGAASLKWNPASPSPTNTRSALLSPNYYPPTSAPEELSNRPTPSASSMTATRNRPSSTSTTAKSSGEGASPNKKTISFLPSSYSTENSTPAPRPSLRWFPLQTWLPRNGSLR